MIYFPQIHADSRYEAAPLLNSMQLYAARKGVFETAFIGSRILWGAAMPNVRNPAHTYCQTGLLFSSSNCFPLKHQTNTDSFQMIWCKLLGLMHIHITNHGHVSGIILCPALKNPYVETAPNTQGI